MTRKVSLLAFFSVLTLAVLPSCGGGPKWTEYHSPKGPILGVPEGWRQVNDLVDNGDLQFEDSEHRRYFIIYSEDRANLERKTLERYSKFVREGLRDGLRSPDWVGPKTMTINGMKAIQYEISGLAGEERFFYLHTTVEGKTQFHQLVGWSPSSLKSANGPLIEKITENFRE